MSRYKYERLFLLLCALLLVSASTGRPQEIYSFLPPSPGMLLREPMRGTVIVAGKVRARSVNGNRLATISKSRSWPPAISRISSRRSAIFVLEDFHATPPLLLARLTRLLTFVSPICLCTERVLCTDQGDTLVSKKGTWARLPTHVRLVPTYMVAGNLEHVLFPEHDLQVSVIDLLGHCDADTAQRHTVALL